jgi:hypothetical protein
MIRNFIRQSQPWTKNVSPVLGRWNRGDNIDRKVDLANIDHCGDRVCGDLYNEMKSVIDVFDQRWNGEISKEDFKNKIENHRKKTENIDSHDNSLYHKSLYEPVRDNYNYSIKVIVDEYNQRWNKNVTIEEYVKTFTRKHHGAC